MGNYYGSPQNSDLLTRYWIEKFDEKDVIETSTVWLPFFSNRAPLFTPDKLTLDIDIKRGNQKYSKMRTRGSAEYTIGDNINGVKSDRFTNIARVFPLMEDFGAVSADQLNLRSFGESPFMDSGKQGRLRKIALNQMQEITRRMVRGHNLLARSSILEGFQPAIFGTTETGLQYDMYRHADMTFTVANAWDTGGATIWADLEEASARVHHNGQVKPDAFFTKGAVITAMIENADFSSKADNRRFNLIGIGASDKSGANPVTSMPSKYQKYIDAGWMYRGWVQLSSGYELHVFVTNDWYEEDAGTIVDQVPDQYGLVCATDARADRYFGPDEKLPLTSGDTREMTELTGIDFTAPPVSGLGIKNPNGLIMPEMFYFDMYKAEDRSNLTIRGQSAPIYVTTHTDVYCTLKNLTT